MKHILLSDHLFIIPPTVLQGSNCLKNLTALPVRLSCASIIPTLTSFGRDSLDTSFLPALTI